MEQQTKGQPPKEKKTKSIEQYRIPYATAVYGETEIEAVVEVLKTRWLGPAQKTKQFEAKMAELFGKKHGLFVNSGSSANLLAVFVHQFPKDGEVITPACTFSTTLSPIVHANLKAVFVDSKIGNYNPSVEDIEKAITPQTVAIMLPDALGMLNDWPRLSKIAKERGIVSIQDSCDTQGAKINGQPSGSWADVVTTSSYFTHTITTGGGGGTIMMDDDELRRRTEVMATWGRRNVGYNEDFDERFNAMLDGEPYDGKFVYDVPGFNLRATDMQAAFGLAQLARINQFNSRRKEVTDKLMHFFKKYEEQFILPEFLPDSEHVLLAFPLTIRGSSPIKRLELLRYLEEKAIQTRLFFAGNILYHPGFKSIEHRTQGNLENATTIMKQTFLVPNHHALTDADLDYLFASFDEFMAR